MINICQQPYIKKSGWFIYCATFESEHARTLLCNTYLNKIQYKTHQDAHTVTHYSNISWAASAVIYGFNRLDCYLKCVEHTLRRAFKSGWAKNSMRVMKSVFQSAKLTREARLSNLQHPLTQSQQHFYSCLQNTDASDWLLGWWGEL